MAYPHANPFPPQGRSTPGRSPRPQRQDLQRRLGFRRSPSTVRKPSSPSQGLGSLHQEWGNARSQLQRELIERGWFDPAAAASRRKPFSILGKVGLVAGVISLLLVAASNQGWAAIGMVIFSGAAIGAFIRGNIIPDISAEGEAAAAPWRSYEARVTALEYDPKLDADLPYIVALGIVSKLEPRLRAASEKGYSPSWFEGDGSQTSPGRGFYPSWTAFHAGMTPIVGGGMGGFVAA